MTRHLIREAGPTGVDTATERGTLPIVIASPGWGSSGWYGAQVLENAAESKVFGKGLHLYLDHPGETERVDRPERSVRDLVAVLAEDATWDASRGLVGEAKVFGPYREMFRDEDFVSAIGVSLRAYADTTVGEAEGRKGTIITELVEAQSVDFVTRAGRGGKVLSVLESARARVAEALNSDTHEALSRAIADAQDGDRYAWVRDFDETTVYFTTEDGTYSQGYTLTDDATTATLTGERVEVRVRTEYVPVTADASEASHNPPAPAGQSTATESEETHMATTQIEETELGRLRQDAERVPTLESERDQATARATEAEVTAQAAVRRADAIEMIAENGHPFTALERRGLLADLPAGEDGTLDREAFTTSLTEAAAESATRAGAGSINGFGATHTDTSTNYVAEAEKAAAAAFGRQIKEA